MEHKRRQGAHYPPGESVGRDTMVIGGGREYLCASGRPRSRNAPVVRPHYMESESASIDG